MCCHVMLNPQSVSKIYQNFQIIHTSNCGVHLHLFTVTVHAWPILHMYVLHVLLQNIISRNVILN